MAKTDPQCSNGSHFHVSLYDKNGYNLFIGKYIKLNDHISCSNVMGYFVGGLIKYSRNLLPLYAPFINSYKRYVPDFLAPITISHWGYGI